MVQSKIVLLLVVSIVNNINGDVFYGDMLELDYVDDR